MTISCIVVVIIPIDEVEDIGSGGIKVRVRIDIDFFFFENCVERFHRSIVERTSFRFVKR